MLYAFKMSRLFAGGWVESRLPCPKRPVPVQMSLVKGTETSRLCIFARHPLRFNCTDMTQLGHASGMIRHALHRSPADL